MGRFEGAEPVGTDTFSETWDALRSRPRMHGAGVGAGVGVGVGVGMGVGVRVSVAHRCP